VIESPLLAAHFTREMDRLWRGAELGINGRLARKLAAQQRTLAADAELGVVVIDQLAQFTGIRAAETFMSHSSYICSRPICWNSSVSLACHCSLSLLFLPLVNSSLAPSSSCFFHWLT